MFPAGARGARSNLGELLSKGFPGKIFWQIRGLSGRLTRRFSDLEPVMGACAADPEVSYCVSWPRR